MIALELVQNPDLAQIADISERHGVDLLSKLKSGSLAVLSVIGASALLFVSFGRTVDSDEPALWIEGIEGKCFTNPKRNQRFIGEMVADCEVLASILGANELRIEASTRNRLKLSLFKTFGFDPLTVGRLVVMRKVLNHGS